MGEVGVFGVSGAVFLWEGRGRFIRFCGDVDVDVYPTLSIIMELSVSSFCGFKS